MAERGSDKRKLSPQLSTPTSTETRYRLKQHEKLPQSQIIAQQSRDSPRLSMSTRSTGIKSSPLLKWKSKEDVALVKFILSTHVHSWPTRSVDSFWESAALFVHQNSQEPLRSSFACSSRVRKVLSKDYTTPKEAQTSLMALTSKLPARVSSEPQALSISYVRHVQVVYHYPPYCMGNKVCAWATHEIGGLRGCDIP